MANKKDAKKSRVLNIEDCDLIIGKHDIVINTAKKPSAPPPNFTSRTGEQITPNMPKQTTENTSASISDNASEEE